MDKKNEHEDIELNWDDNSSSKTGLSESFKKLLATGLSTVVMSEEGLKNYLQDLKLPKEALGTLLKGVRQSKAEIVARVGDEFSQLIKKIDVVDELTKFLRENKIKCSMEIEFSKKDKDKSGK